MKTEPVTPLPECVEGPQAFQRFDATMTALLSVSHATLVRREHAYRKRSRENPNRPGPKPKVKSRASRAPRA